MRERGATFLAATVWESFFLLFSSPLLFVPFRTTHGVQEKGSSRIEVTTKRKRRRKMRLSGGSFFTSSKNNTEAASFEHQTLLAEHYCTHTHTGGLLKETPEKKVTKIMEIISTSISPGKRRRRRRKYENGGAPRKEEGGRIYFCYLSPLGSPREKEPRRCKLQSKKGNLNETIPPR